MEFSGVRQRTRCNSQKHETKAGWGQSLPFQGHGARSQDINSANYDSLCCRPTGYIVHTREVHKRSLLDYTLLPGKFQTNTKYRLTQRRHLKLVVRHTPTFVFSVVKAD